MIIILALVLLIAALVAGIALSMTNLNKQDTKLTIKGNETLTKGDSILVRLTDDNGTALANQTVNITITDKDKSSSHYSVVTNAKGVGKMKINHTGKYKITADYRGNDRYGGSNATKKITVEEKKAASASTSSQSSSLPYSIDNLPPSNDPNPETNRYQIDEYTVVQEYSDNYRSVVDLRTGQRSGGFF